MGKTVAFIPARGGSKSIPNKNIKTFCGKPLIYWNLNELKQVDIIDEVVVATDSIKIRDIVESFNFNKVKIYDREQKNAQDCSSTESVMLEYISRSNLIKDDIFMLVQATSPLTTKKDFINGLSLYKNSKYDSILSCVRDKSFFWNDNGNAINYNYANRPRRQEFEGVLKENGAFYINSVKNIINTKNRLSGHIGIIIMPSYTGYEIDEEDDWIIAEKLMKKYNINKMHKRINEKNHIKLFLTDVDGVLTDAGMYYSENGDELKKFNTRDGKGFDLLRKKGIKTGLITSEDTKIVEKRASKLQVNYLIQGAQLNKFEKVVEICKKEKIQLKNVAYIGDDINDLELLKGVGIKACPHDAEKEIKNIDGIMILKNNGGEGVVREFISYLLGTEIY